MKTLFTFIQFILGAALWGAGLLMLMWLFFPKIVHAEENGFYSPLLNDRPSNSALVNSERDYRIGLMLDYLRHQAPAMVPGLPDTLRGPVHYMIGQLKSAEEKLGVTSGIEGDVSPTFSLITPGEGGDPEAMWLSPDYHHMHGMSPFDDALMLGFNYRNAFSTNRVRLDVHPYYAQSWHCMDGYWGIETTLDIGSPMKGTMGKLVIRYDNGNTDLMDQAHGLDMHADFSFDDRLSLSAGMQKHADSDLGNYLLLRWKMEFGR